MRITAGTHRSRVLKTLDNEMTRSTADRVKEAVFSSLGAYFTGGNVLDLFGGSGGIALEAISRGVDFAYIVDKNTDAIHIIKANVAMLKEQDKCRVIHADYYSALQQVKNQTFSFIYLDPPYTLSVIDEILQFIDKNNMLSKDGCIVVEVHKQAKLEEDYTTFKLKKTKQYGIAKIAYYK